MKHIIFLIIIMINLSCGGNNERSASGLVVHPIEENIPHYENDHISVDKNQLVSGVNNYPGIIKKLHSYLHDPNNSDLFEIPLPVSGVRTVEVKSISEDILLILDKRSDQLIQYNRSTNDTLLIASRGRGPGDIAYAKDMNRYNNDIYISMEDMRVSKFSCQNTPCNYDKTVPLEFSPISFAYNNENYIIFGQTPYLGEEDYTIDENSIRIVDDNGGVLTSFGENYRTKDWIVLFTIRDGHIRYSMKNDYYIHSIELLPYIYIYDQKYEINSIFYLSEFIQGEVVFNPVFNGASPPSVDFSYIHDLTIVEDNYLIITTTTRYDEIVSDNDNECIFEQDYYVIDLSNQSHGYLGSSCSKFPQNILITDEWVFLNSNGKIYLVNT
ncbi:MAG: hypothetical protein WD355_07795 [Balneolaceae bacterium]